MYFYALSFNSLGSPEYIIMLAGCFCTLLGKNGLCSSIAYHEMSYFEGKEKARQAYHPAPL
jgi:hypothetical protein